MPQKLIDLTGQRFGKYVVLRRVVGRWGTTWLCRCDCGTTKQVQGVNLKSGSSGSCGCTLVKHGHTRRGPGGVRAPQHPMYSTYYGMLERCHNKNSQAYANYGGRGIRVCEKWRNSYEAFLEDMGPKPSRKHQIERIDNDKGYEPGNCEWTTHAKQQTNRRTNMNITFDGLTLCLSEWSRLTGLNVYTIRYRILQGWSVEKALQTPPTPRAQLKKLSKEQTGVST